MISIWDRGVFCCCRIKAGHIPTRCSARARTARSTWSTGTTWGTTTQINDQIVQSLVNIFPNSLGNEGVTSARRSISTESVYFSPVADTVQAFSVEQRLVVHGADVPVLGELQSAGGTLAISANGAPTEFFGLCKSTRPSSPGVLHAYDATNLANELYNSNQAGPGTRWIPGEVQHAARGERQGLRRRRTQLTVYGLLPNPPTGSSDVVASAGVQTQANTLTPVVSQVQNLQRLAAPAQHVTADPGDPSASSSGSTQGFSLGLIPSRVPAFPGGPLAAAKTKPVVTHQVLNQPWINYRRNVVSTMWAQSAGSMVRIRGLCLDIWDDTILRRRLGVDEA